MSGHNRYRVVDGRTCLDLRARHSAQLFDTRDPAPFRERDLDAAVVEYLLDSVREIPASHPLRIVVTLSQEPEPRLAADVIVEAVRAHFQHEHDQLQRRLGEHVRRGQMFLVLGLIVLVAFLTLAEVATALPAGTFREVLREGLIITGWVAMWRPLEVLLYDWWPIVDERRYVSRLLSATVEVGYIRESADSPRGADPS